jgi:SulP family sulfate permease
MPLTGGFPVFGSLSNTAANVELGGKSPMALIVRSAVLLLVLLIFTSVFSPLPKSTLGVILIMTVYKMIDFTAVPKLWDASKSDLGVWSSACVLTLFMGVKVGMASAAGLSLLVFVARTSMPRIIVMAREIGSLHFVPIDQQQEHVIDKKGVLVLSFQAPLWYANAELLKDKAITLLTTEKIHTIVVEMSAVSFADTTAVETLRDLNEQVARLQKNVVLCNVNPRVSDVLKKNKLLEHFNGMALATFAFPDSIYEAIRRANILYASRRRLTKTDKKQ